jgi:hypothetical protein
LTLSDGPAHAPSCRWKGAQQTGSKPAARVVSQVP